MAARQMEEIQRKLAMLNYPRANAVAQSLLFAGMERYALLEWLFFRGTSRRSPNKIFKGTPWITTKRLLESSGRGSYEDRTEMLHLIVDLVEVAKDIQLIDSIAKKRAQIFSEECKLFPADVQIQSIYPLPDVSELEKKLSEQSKIFSSLQLKVDDLASKYAYNPYEDYEEVESRLREHLESFLETAKSFNTISTKEIHPWTHMMEVPQLHGFGSAANRLLKAYKMLLKFLRNLKNLRDSYAALAIGSSDSVAGEPSSVTRIISECESALTWDSLGFHCS